MKEDLLRPTNCRSSCEGATNPAGGLDNQPTRRIPKIIMNTLAKWNPFSELNEMQNRLTTLFGRPTRRFEGDGDFGFSEWTPLVDVTEDDKEFQIKAELPEVKKEDVKVLIDNGILQISGERKFEKEEKGRKYHRMERSYGSFERSFTLPEASKPEGMTAEYDDGVLTVHVPKNKEVKTKLIEVKVH
jgi:HSP20 family protein